MLSGSLVDLYKVWEIAKKFHLIICVIVKPLAMEKRQVLFQYMVILRKPIPLALNRVFLAQGLKI
jgi:hypothetical protein